MMRIAFIGHGKVGGALAGRLAGLGHDVTIAARDPSSDGVRALLGRHPAIQVAPPAHAVTAAAIVFLATPFAANSAAVTPLADALVGKVLVDCTNPVGPGLSHAFGSERSTTGELAALLPRTRVVKAFTIYGYENFGEAPAPGAGDRPAMLYCGDDPTAKVTVGGLIEELGWEPLDVGGTEQAVHLEHMTLLWVRMVRMGGESPRLLWAALRR